jgi:mannose-6-phosphate isomerase-like protein (cupin superfamily)
MFGVCSSHEPVAIAAGLEPFDFHVFARFNSGAFAVFRASSTGASQWEMHPDTDELLFVLAGAVTVELLTETERTLVPLTGGQLVIVPQGTWHRHRNAVDVVELYYTPGHSVASDDEDPRTTLAVDWIDATPADDIASP